MRSARRRLQGSARPGPKSETFDRDATRARGILRGVILQHGYVPNGDVDRRYPKPPAPEPVLGSRLSPGRRMPEDQARQLGSVVKWLGEVEDVWLRDPDGEPLVGEAAMDEFEEGTSKIVYVLDWHSYDPDGKPYPARPR